MLPGFINRPARVSAMVAIALLALACGGTAPTTSPSPTQSPSQPASTPPTTPAPTATPSATPSPTPTVEPSPTPAAPSLLLEVTSEGGFIAPTARLGQVPSVVVDTAGNIYMADQSVTPGLIQPVLVRNVGEQGAAQILAAMRAAGLDKEGDDGGVVADAGVTVFTATIDGEEIVNRVTQSAPGRPGASPSPALALLGQLLDPAITWGAADVADAAFTPTAYKVYVAPAAAGAAPTAEWPLTSDLAAFGSPATPDFGVTGMRTGVVAGADAAPLAAALADASADTVVTSNGDTYQVWIRPLLPPEIAQ